MTSNPVSKTSVPPEAVGALIPALLLQPLVENAIKHAAALRAAGLRRVNVSVDSLDPDRFRAITQGGDLERYVLSLGPEEARGIAKAGVEELSSVPGISRLLAGTQKLTYKDSRESRKFPDTIAVGGGNP